MSKTETTYHVRVDYSQSLQEMVEAGRYGWVNPSITQENFPIENKGTQEVDLVLVDPEKDVKTKEAEDEIKIRCLRPANIAELLAFGARYPDLRKKLSIVALGSVRVHSENISHVPCFDLFRLNLQYYEREWAGYWQFLAAPI